MLAANVGEPASHVLCFSQVIVRSRLSLRVQQLSGFQAALARGAFVQASGSDTAPVRMQPPLGYVAPELANADGQTAASSISSAADIFSLGTPHPLPPSDRLHLRLSRRQCAMLPVAVLAKVNWLCYNASWRSKHACAACFAYEALAGKPLLRVSYDLEEYNGKLASLHMAPMAGAPVSLRNALQAMLAQSASLRPPAISFTAAGYFQVCSLLADQSQTAPVLC